MAVIRSVIGRNTSQIKTAFRAVIVAATGIDAAIFSLRMGFIALAGGAGVAMVHRLIKIGDEIAKTSARLGIGSDALQELRYAADLAGVSQEDLTKSLEQFVKRLGEVKSEVTDAQVTLGKLGLKLADIKKLAPEDALKVVADRLQAIQNPMERNALLAELFGKNGLIMGNLLKQGSAGLAAAADEAHRFGVILDKTTLRKAEEASDEFDRIGKVLSITGVRMAAEFLPALTAVRELVTSESFQSGVKAVAAGLSDLTKFMVENKELVLGLASAYAGARLGAAIGRNFGAYGTVIGTASGATLGFLATQRGLQPTLEQTEKRVADLTDRLAELKHQLADTERFGQTQAAKKGFLEGAIGATEAELARATEVLAEFTKKKEEAAAPPIARQAPAVDAGPAFDAKKAESQAKAMADLAFKTAVARGAFKSLAEGFPEAAFAMELFNTATQRAFLETGKLPANLQRWNELQLQLNGALLTQQMLNPYEKYNLELERLNQLMAAAAINQETYNRKLGEMQEQLIQATGAGISLKEVMGALEGSIAGAFETAIVEGEDLQKVLKQLLKDIAKAIIRMLVLKALKLALDFATGGATAFLPFEKGGAFRHGRITAFADGGVVKRPVVFPMASGLGLMGEKGPEAVMPLERGADGKLGVRGAGSGMVLNIDARGADISVAERVEMAVAAAVRGRERAVPAVDDYRRRFPLRGT